MAKKKTATKSKTFWDAIGCNKILNETTNFVLGLTLAALALVAIISMVSYFKTGAIDQSILVSLRPGELLNRNREFANYCGSLGALTSYYLIGRCFGIPAFLIPAFLLLCSLRMMGAFPRLNLLKWFFGMAIIMAWGSVTFAKFLSPLMGEEVFNPGGDHGAYVCQWLENVVGAPGLVAILLVVAISFMTYVTTETINVIRKMLNPIDYLSRKVKFTVEENRHHDQYAREDDTAENPVVSPAESEDPQVFDDPQTQTVEFLDDDLPGKDTDEQPLNPSHVPETKEEEKAAGEKEVSMRVEMAKGDEKASGTTVASTADLSTPINPREPFVSWKFPTLGLLKEYDSDARPSFATKEELEANKNRIIKVLDDFGVQISSIRATVGPTITLYEITPAKGVRIAKIKNLENDIALSLAAIGIRIIAPIPGKGTIGIEVPNTTPSVVSMYSILNSKKFQETDMELPVALGKTISNEVFMVDLAKIPHLLVAGATGQGKSVGLNAIITSLLYKKHPNELKIVLVDPKKVEFSIYSPIANRFMAAVEENEEEPIITDVQKVVNTLKGLCVLMDERYDRLKAAGARNIKEYNRKFLNHHLNPEEGHEYMPYIVVVIDEFGDLMLTAGKEIELPITRIAQLARAVGIHMIIATQRPTTSIITGNIKANFPGRIAFRVGSMMDSRIILDRSGAQQLVGRGDMLYLNGGEPVLDPLFEEVARYVVINQQGSTSKIQREFGVGYNRAGRLMDKLQKAGIVGEARGAKPREVLIGDENSLSRILSCIKG